MAPSKTKKKIVEEFTKLIDEYNVIASVNMENLPAKQLQTIVKSLRNEMILKMGKTRLIKLAIEKSKKDNIKEIETYLKGMPALIFTKENPFKLYKILEKSKSNAPAKTGQKAPKDIIVPAGPTGFAPGPIIGELGSAGIKAGIENGKVVIKEDSLVVKEGDPIEEKLAGVLSRLGIEPMEIGLNIVAIYEDGSIFKKDILAVDESKYISDIQDGARISFNLAVEIGYPTKENIEFLIGKVFNDSKNLAIGQDIITDETLGNVIGKAETQMKNLANKLNLPEVEKMKKPEEEETKKDKEKEQEKPEEASQEEAKEPEKTKDDSPEEKTDEKKEEVEKESADKENETEEKTLETASEKDVQEQNPTTEDDMKKAEENLRIIQEKIQKS